MNWEAIGAIGELIGAMAVVITLVFLAIQVRYSTKSMDESNRLQRAAAIDRHADSVSRWRGRVVENEDLARIWFAAIHDEELSDLDQLRLNNLWIIFINTQRSNYERAKLVGEQGLAEQATKSIAAESLGSDTLKARWRDSRAWHGLASPAFVAEVEKEMQTMEAEGPGFFPSGSSGQSQEDD